MWRRVLLTLAILLLPQAADAQRRNEAAVPVVRTLGMPVYIGMAEEVSDQLLQSPSLRAQTATGPVRVVLSIPANNTSRWDLRVEDIFNTVRNRLVSSGAARVFDAGYTDAGLVLNSEFTSTRTEGRRAETVVTYTLTLTTIEGEFLGAWSAHRAYVQ